MSYRLCLVENVWLRLRANKLLSRVFETYDVIMDAACEACNSLIDQPENIAVIGLSDWAHIGLT